MAEIRQNSCKAAGVCWSAFLGAALAGAAPKMTTFEGEYYSVIAIQPEWVLEQEAMGSKEKFWYRETHGSPDWLFKYPQPNTGQHWAEKIAAEIAGQLDIFHAKVELAVFGDVRGSTSESFAREGRELFHGNQVLAGKVLGYDPGRRFRQSSHTLANIFSALERAFRKPESGRAAKERIAGYFVLDALIGNTDRHHENWGIIRKRTVNGWTGMLAPSFDQASSLGRELLDEGPGKSRKRFLRENRISQYSENAPGAIYWDENDARAVSPLELVRRGSAIYPELFRRAFASLGRLEREDLERILARVPAVWMSDIARQFALELTCHNLKQLKEIAS